MISSFMPSLHVMLVVFSLGAWLLGCTAPTYVSVPPGDPVRETMGLIPARPEQAIIREQHLGLLHTNARFLEAEVLRAEQQRLAACREPEAAQVGTVAYERCRLRDQLYEQLREEARLAKAHYLRAVSGHGGIPR
jgi:hypothetical protein